MVSSHEEMDRAIELHKKFVVIDAHSDIPLEIAIRRRKFGEERVFERIHVPKFVSGGVNACGATVFCDSANAAFGSEYQPFLMAIQIINYMKHEFEESPDAIVHAKSAADIRRSKKKWEDRPPPASGGGDAARVRHRQSQDLLRSRC